MGYAEEHWLELWRYDGADPLDEAGIGDGWLPAGPDWTEHTGGIAAAALSLDPDQGGWKVDFTKVGESRLDWPDLTPIAVVGRHWSGDGGYTARETVMWGYLHGDGTSSYDRAGVQRGQRTASYAGRWADTPLPALQFGRVNLLAGATFDAARSTAALADPAAEVQYGEYVQQADVTGQAAIDGSSDTVAVSAAIAEAAPSTSYGNTVKAGRPVPRAYFLYGGRSSRTIGAGGETIVVGLVCRAQHIAWGSMEDRAAVPAFYEEGDGPVYPAEKNTDKRNTAFIAGQGRNGGYSLRMRCKSGVVADPNVRIGIQWNTASSWTDLPVLMRCWFKAADGTSVGKQVRVTLKGAAPEESAGAPGIVTLISAYQLLEMRLDNSGRYGGVMLRIQNEAGEVAASDLLVDIDDLEILMGYSDEAHARATNKRFAIAYDDGAGHEDRLGLFTNSIIPGGFTIAPDSALFLVDDAVAAKAKFDFGDRQVASLRAKAPHFYFAPGIGRFKTMYPNTAARGDYDVPGADEDVIEEILFSGLTWTQGANPQALRRKAPLLTGTFAAVNYPTLDLADDFGPSCWTYDLGEYAPPTLLEAITDSATVLTVSDHRHYDASGVIALDDELIAYTSVEEGIIRLGTRGYNPAGAPFAVGHPQGPAAHSEETPIFPWRNGARQTGHLVSAAEIRRRIGRARILSGKVLYSNEAAPPSPDPDYELTTGGYWKVLGLWANQTAEVASLPAPGGYVECRWLSFAVTNMARYAGQAQRAKINEALAYQYLPGGAAAGAYASRDVSTLGDMVGHLLVRWGGLPAAKYLPDPAAALLPVASTPLAAGSLRAALDAATALGGLVVYADALGRVRLVPRPASPYFTAPDVSHTWALGDARAALSGKWRPQRAVAQVRLVAREVAALRVHAVRYPDVPGKLGKILELKDITVASVEMARAHARTAFRQGNARRSLPFPTGWIPGLDLFDRHVIAVVELDQGAGFDGVNAFVAGFAIAYEKAAQGSRTWTTSLELEELAL